MTNYFQLAWPRLSRSSLPRGVDAHCGPCRMFKNGSKWKRRGVAATEFAIVAPVFFMMVIGFIEFGRALMVQEVLINASRVGARMASTTGSCSGAVQSAVTSYASSVAVPNASVTVSRDPATAPAGSAITVTAAVPFDKVSWMHTAWFL